MSDVPVSPDMTSTPIPFTTEQLRAIYDRIELIDRHFDGCCAFQMDRCHYADEYNELYGRLRMAGLSEAKTLDDRDAFESWLTERP